MPSPSAMNAGAAPPKRTNAADTITPTMRIVSKATSPTNRPVSRRVMANIYGLTISLLGGA